MWCLNRGRQSIPLPLSPATSSHLLFTYLLMYLPPPSPSLRFPNSQHDNSQNVSRNTQANKCCSGPAQSTRLETTWKAVGMSHITALHPFQRMT